jgi:hypothetical protein
VGDVVHLHRIARVNLPVARQTNNIPMYLSVSRARRGQRAFLSTNVPIRSRDSRGQHDQRRPGRALQLLRPFPEFGTFAIEEYTDPIATTPASSRWRSGSKAGIR